MNQGAEAADQVFNMSLRALEVFCKVSGVGAKHLALFLYVQATSQKKTKGRIALKNLMKHNQQLNVFSIPKDQLEKFTYSAKKYGVLYCVVRDKNNIDNMCDVIVKSIDAPMIERIVSKYKLATVNVAEIQNELDKGKIKDLEQDTEMTPEKTNEFMDSLLQKEVPLQKSTEKSNPSKNFSLNIENEHSNKERQSVKKELFEIKTDLAKHKSKDMKKVSKSMTKKKKAKKKGR